MKLVRTSTSIDSYLDIRARPVPFVARRVKTAIPVILANSYCDPNQVHWASRPIGSYAAFAVLHLPCANDLCTWLYLILLTIRCLLCLSVMHGEHPLYRDVKSFVHHVRHYMVARLDKRPVEDENSASIHVSLPLRQCFACHYDTGLPDQGWKTNAGSF